MKKVKSLLIIGSIIQAILLSNAKKMLNLLIFLWEDFGGESMITM